MRRISAVILMLAGAALAKDSCLECHSRLEGKLQTPASLFKDDIHVKAGFSCKDCHGGDPSSDDPKVSMSPARGYKGKVSRTATPALCASCHSDASKMHKFNPRQRVDQHSQYLTSVHGKRLASGDVSAANCIDCHSVHDIRPVKNGQSPVHPQRLPQTCGKCHADARHMAKYKIPVTQLTDYQGSVHWEALSKRGDLSAPSCASCHGNHGATPPQVSSIAAVCGTCHPIMEELYNGSPHKPVFDAMGVAGCEACHGNHAVKRTSPALLAGKESVCSQCHDGDSAGGKVAVGMLEHIAKLQQGIKGAADILQKAKVAGMEVSDSELKLGEARQALVQARVAVHGFEEKGVAKATQEGLKITAECFRGGEKALGELGFRRRGLLFSLAAIFVTILGLWLAIRQQKL
jgi:predicted CXXCH cytochrome family protein